MGKMKTPVLREKKVVSEARIRNRPQPRRSRQTKATKICSTCGIWEWCFDEKKHAGCTVHTFFLTVGGSESKSPSIGAAKTCMREQSPEVVLGKELDCRYSPEELREKIDKRLAWGDSGREEGNYLSTAAVDTAGLVAKKTGGLESRLCTWRRRKRNKEPWLKILKEDRSSIAMFSPPKVSAGSASDRI